MHASIQLLLCAILCCSANVVTSRFKRYPTYPKENKFELKSSIDSSITQTVFDDISSESNDEKEIEESKKTLFNSKNENEIQKRSNIEDSIRNFDQDTDGALIVIDVNSGTETTQNADKKSAIGEKRDSEIYDGRGFSIVLDNNGDSNEQQPRKKDEVYKEMRSVYREMEHEFSGFVKEPKDRKKVRVIVITPEDLNNENPISRDNLPEPKHNTNNDLTESTTSKVDNLLEFENSKVDNLAEVNKENILYNKVKENTEKTLSSEFSKKSELDIDIDKLKHVKENLKLLNEDDDKVSDGLLDDNKRKSKSEQRSEKSESEQRSEKTNHIISKIQDDNLKYNLETTTNGDSTKLDSSSIREAERQLNTLSSYTKLINNDDIVKDSKDMMLNHNTSFSAKKTEEPNLEIKNTNLNNENKTNKADKTNSSIILLPNSSSTKTPIPTHSKYYEKMIQHEIQFLSKNDISEKNINIMNVNKSSDNDKDNNKNGRHNKLNHGDRDIHYDKAIHEPTINHHSDNESKLETKQNQSDSSPKQNESSEANNILSDKENLQKEINNRYHEGKLTTLKMTTVGTSTETSTTPTKSNTLHEQVTSDDADDRKHAIAKYVQTFLLNDRENKTTSSNSEKGEKFVIKFHGGNKLKPIMPPDNPRPNAAQIIETTPSALQSNGDKITIEIENPTKSSNIEKTHEIKLVPPTTTSSTSSSSTDTRHKTTHEIPVPSNSSKHRDPPKPSHEQSLKNYLRETTMKTKQGNKISHEVKVLAVKNKKIPEQDSFKTPTPRGFPNQSPQPTTARTVNKRKAEAIIEFLNKDPLESWHYQYNSLKSLDLNSTILRSGLVNAGNIERLKGVMKRALEGKDITLSVVGGSISAGGGLYKDKGNIDGLYYKGLMEWWNKMISPLTGSEMKINNIAIGSIGTDYFSYCIKNHISDKTDIVLWELAANDFNRYKMQPTKGARPLERLTRMILELPKKPALLYVNFFKGVDYKASRESCPNFEDQGEDIIAHYYKIPSLSWRAMVCGGLVRQEEGFKIDSLFSHDQYHPSLRGHAQMSLLLLLHLRHVMRAVLQSAISRDGYIENFEDQYILPEPLFIGPKSPEPLCWTLITADMSQQISNTLSVRISNDEGFKLEYATNFPIRFDKVICWKAEKPFAQISLQFFIPENYGPTGLKRLRSGIAITTHTRWGGSATLWIDDMKDKSIFIKEGRPNDPGKRTQVDSIANDIPSGSHTLNIRAHDKGFCLSAIMVDGS